MRKALLLILAFSLGGVGISLADMGVSGYMAPHFMLTDMGEGVDPNTGDEFTYKSNVGFGMYFNRFTFKGKFEGGEIVKAVGFKVETDISGTTTHSLQWAYVEPYFTPDFSIRLGHLKRQFSREVLHSTSNLLTAMRHPTSSFLKGLGYVSYSYGLEAAYRGEMFSVAAGAYSSGTPKDVENQDPALDFAGRVIIMPTEGLEVGLNACMATLPIGGSNQSYYREDEYESNSGLAYGFDVDYKTDFDKMSLWAQAELGMGDNWAAGAKEPGAEDTWEDYEWYSFMYYYLKARFMFTEDLGFQVGYSTIDPNTENDYQTAPGSENDEITMITPGLVYFWTPFCRTEAEVQMHTIGGGVDANGDELDDMNYTHFLLQQVLVWK